MLANQPRLLVRTPNWIGDHIMARHCYRALENYYGSVDWIGPTELLTLDFGLTPGNKHPLDYAKRHELSQMLNTARQLRRYRYDAVVSLASASSALLPFCLAGIPSRVGFGAPLWLTHSLKWEGRAAGLHKARLYESLFTTLTSQTMPVLVSQAPGERPREKLIVLAPGASIALRQWPYFAELMRQLANEYEGWKIVAVGSAKEAVWGDKFAAVNAPSFHNQIGKTSLPELVELCSQASLVVANDSGVAHLAASLAGAPTVVLFGPGDPAFIAPEASQVECVRLADLRCSPCESSVCRAPYGYQACLKQLDVLQVLQSIRKILRSIH